MRIVKYLESTISRGITYVQSGRGRPVVAEMNGDVLSSVRMSGFADASLGDDPGSRAARVGTIVLVNGGFVCGKSSKLKRVQISSAGAELHGLSACAHELTAMRNQLTELGFQLGGASVLHGDNTASIDAARHPGKHRSALRHLELHAFAIRDLIREEQVRLQWVDTKSNPADLLTKAVPSKALFDKFAKLIMGAVDDTAKVFLLSLRSVLVKERRRVWH